MAEFRILLGKIKALNVNGASDHLHPHTHFQMVDNGVLNTIERNRDWFERMTERKRRRHHGAF